MKQFAMIVAGVFVGLLLFFVILPFAAIVMIASAAAPAGVPPVAVLQLDLRGALPDQEPSSPLVALRTRSLSVMTIEQTLRRAEDDNRIKGLFVRLPEGGIAPAAADELRLAIRHFRAVGKSVIVHSQGLYPSGVVTSTYMLGASGDQLWMQPGAPFEVTGVASEDTFFKRFFDKYGIKPDFEQRAEFKTAVNPYLHDDYTPAHRESELSWMGSVYDTALNAAAADRKQSAAALRALIEHGPYSASEALDKGLIDKLGQVHDAQVASLRAAGPGAKMIEFADYVSSSRRGSDAVAAPVIAVIGAEGDIVTGTSGDDLFAANASIHSDDVSNAIYRAAQDDAVKAIVFRVSSPGGGDTASEQILAAVRAAKARGKPVVVSMGAYGASGGYWISSEASAIVAEPTTLTGSIGVFGGKFVLGEALGRFGVDFRQIGIGGEFASAYDAGKPFTPAQKAAFSRSIDQVYDGFIARVAAGRNLTPDRVREIAKGRVWTGAQAKTLGLVDGLGGFYDAVDRAKALSGLSGQAVRLKTFPAQSSPLGALSRAMGVSEESIRTLGVLSAMVADPKMQNLLSGLDQARLREQGAMVLAPIPVGRP